MNFLDKTISFFSPAAALKRAQYRVAIDLVERKYEGARKDRRSKGWQVNEYEENTTAAELVTLKSRSRDLYRNNPYAYRAHNSIAHNTTGTGILPAIANTKLKKVWQEWAENIMCDFDGNFDFYGLQNLCMKTMSIHGECLVLRVPVKATDRVPLELKVISTKYLDNSKDIERLKGGYISGGIQYDANGKRTGYWLYPNDPTGAVAVESKFWKEKDVIHLLQIDEPGQSRGVPFGSASMMSLHDFDDYADAQLMRQKIAACFSVFVTKSDATDFDTADSEERLEKVEPGIIEHLEPGKSVTFASPPPAEGYAEYSRNVLTGIASGFGVSYESMTGDLSNVNFSSGRMGWLEYQRMIESWQWFILIPKLCKRVWLWFVEAAVIAGKLPKSAPLSVEWTAPRRQMIDPVKETNGLLAQVRAGFISWQEAVRSLGYTPEEILEEIKTSAKMFDEAGVKPECDPRFDGANKKALDTNSEGDSGE
ncbi:MAG: phage portal protein [Bacteroidetes bacterium]|nr:phage portal protein [Bacteroidota bacterium]